jgi:hypothetical protein
VHDDLVQMNIGGLIFGIQSLLGAVSWLSDTNVVLYESTLARLEFISAIVRDNALIVTSSLNNEVRVFGHGVSTPSLDNWTEKWLSSAKAELDSGKARYWNFTNVFVRDIALVERLDFGIASKYVDARYLGHGRFDIALSPILTERLRAPLSDKGDGSIPFRLSYLRD